MKNVKITLAIILLCLAMCFADNAWAQTEVKKTSQGYIPVKKVEAKPQDTREIYTDPKGVVYPVYRTSKGKLFIIRQSKKSGKEYRQYLKVT